METPPGTAEGVREAWGESAADAGPGIVHCAASAHVKESSSGSESDRDDALLESAEEALDTHRPLDGYEAFAVLFALHAEATGGGGGGGGGSGRGRDVPRVLARLPTRMSASPITFEPAGAAFCVAPRGGGHRRGEAQQQLIQPEQYATQVSFQSFANAEIYWSAKRDEQGRRFGAAARAMSRRARNTAGEGAGGKGNAASTFHGYAGERG